jgi:cob(I)alamin adenosyltransferase
MGHRLSKIYTRTGDTGTTGLGDGSRVDKDDLRVEAYGTIDELNSVIGVILAHGVDDEVRSCLLDVQHDLFDLGGELSVPELTLLKDEYVTRLEQQLDHFNADLAPLKEFVLPGGGMAASQCHIARTVARRAERRLVTLRRETPISEVGIRYLNRLSDLLFVVARRVALRSGHEETLWDQGRRKS